MLLIFLFKNRRLVEAHRAQSVPMQTAGYRIPWR
jgi:hypothetical protein